MERDTLRIDGGNARRGAYYDAFGQLLTKTTEKSRFPRTSLPREEQTHMCVCDGLPRFIEFYVFHFKL
jgi:hypothetical protein